MGLDAMETACLLSRNDGTVCANNQPRYRNCLYNCIDRSCTEDFVSVFSSCVLLFDDNSEREKCVTAKCSTSCLSQSKHDIAVSKQSTINIYKCFGCFRFHSSHSPHYRHFGHPLHVLLNSLYFKMTSQSCSAYISTLFSYKLTFCIFSLLIFEQAKVAQNVMWALANKF